VIWIFAFATAVIILRCKSTSVIRRLVQRAILNEDLVVLAIYDLLSIAASKKCDATAFVYLALPVHTCITLPAFSAGIWLCWAATVPAFYPLTLRDALGKSAFIRAWGEWVIDKVTTVVELPLISVTT